MRVRRAADADVISGNLNKTESTPCPRNSTLQTSPALSRWPGKIAPPFEAIEALYGLQEKDVIHLMRRELKPSSFRLWRKRVTGRSTKHRQLRPEGVSRGYCPTQYKHR